MTRILPVCLVLMAALVVGWFVLPGFWFLCALPLLLWPLGVISRIALLRATTAALAVISGLLILLHVSNAATAQFYRQWNRHALAGMNETIEYRIASAEGGSKDVEFQEILKYIGETREQNVKQPSVPPFDLSSFEKNIKSVLTVTHGDFESFMKELVKTDLSVKEPYKHVYVLNDKEAFLIGLDLAPEDHQDLAHEPRAWLMKVKAIPAKVQPIEKGEKKPPPAKGDAKKTEVVGDAKKEKIEITSEELKDVRSIRDRAQHLKKWSVVTIAAKQRHVKTEKDHEALLAKLTPDAFRVSFAQSFLEHVRNRQNSKAEALTRILDDERINQADHLKRAILWGANSKVFLPTGLVFLKKGVESKLRMFVDADTSKEDPVYYFESGFIDGKPSPPRAVSMRAFRKEVEGLLKATLVVPLEKAQAQLNRESSRNGFLPAIHANVRWENYVGKRPPAAAPALAEAEPDRQRRNEGSRDAQPSPAPAVAQQSFLHWLDYANAEAIVDTMTFRQEMKARLIDSGFILKEEPAEPGEPAFTVDPQTHLMAVYDSLAGAGPFLMFRYMNGVIQYIELLCLFIIGVLILVRFVRHVLWEWVAEHISWEGGESLRQGFAGCEIHPWQALPDTMEPWQWTEFHDQLRDGLDPDRPDRPPLGIVPGKRRIWSLPAWFDDSSGSLERRPFWQAVKGLWIQFVRGTMSLRMLHAGVRAAGQSRNLEQARTAVGQESEKLQSSSRAAYRVYEVIMFVLPSIAMIGTLIGASYALSRSSKVVAANNAVGRIDGVNTITAAMAVAMDTTLVGTSLAIFALLMLRLAQRIEERRLDRARSQALEFLDALQRVHWRNRT